MRGEDLLGLNIEELQQLEMSLEAGLGRIIETKVCYYTVTFSTINAVVPFGICNN